MPPSLTRWHASLQKELDPSRVITSVETIYNYAKWNSTQKLRELGPVLCKQMVAGGFETAEIIEVPSDGVIHHGGWCMPIEWSPISARLVLTNASGDALCVADYQKCPHHLVMFSAGTDGVDCDLVSIASNPSDEDLKSVHGKMALLHNAPSIEFSQKLMQAGAAGFVTDFVSRIKGVKEGPELDHAVQYLNYNIAPWAIPDDERAVGFAITPAMGKRVREALEAGTVRAKAVAEVNYGPGTMPVVHGYLPGKSKNNIILTGHIDEPGGSDNASGPALILEIMRCLRKLKRESLNCGIRVLFSVEVRGVQALLNNNPDLFKRAVAGLNIDMVGTDQREAKCPMYVSPSIPGVDDFSFPLLAKVLDKLSAESEAFEWRQKLLLDDNNLCDPAIMTSMPVLTQGPDATYHTSLDTPDRLAPACIHEIGTALGALVATLADAEVEDVLSIMKLNYAYGVQKLHACAEHLVEKAPFDAQQQLQHVVDRERRRIRRTAMLSHTMGMPVPYLDSDIAAEYKDGSICDLARIRCMVSRFEDELTALGNGLLATLPECACELDPDLVKEAEQLVPRKSFKGHFTLDNLPEEQTSVIAAAAGNMCWCGPLWLQVALGLSNGSRSLLEIYHAMRAEGFGSDLGRLLKTFKALIQCNFVRNCTRLTREDIVAALKEVGVTKGMTLMVHSGLSRYGYVEGGADTFIDSLREVLGADGTLCMPTHSLSWAGTCKFDPKSSPSLVGAVTNTFRKRKGVVRSMHPSHSVAVQGPMAEELVEGHNDVCDPLGREGFWGHFVENEGWVLMMAPRRSNTLMHAPETWAGVKEPSAIASASDGSMIELHNLPWHVDWFEDIYAALEGSGRLKTVKLGDAEVELMRSTDIIEIGLKLIRENPLRVSPEYCECAWCERVKEANK